MWNKSGSQNASVCLNPCITLVLCLLFGVGTCFGTAEMQKAFLDAQMIYDGWKANYGHINSMKFKSVDKLIHAENPRGNPSRFSHLDKIIDGKRLYVRHTGSEAGFEDEDKIIVMSFNGSVGKRYIRRINTGEIYRGLLGATPEIRNHVKEYLHLDPVEITSERASNMWDESRYKIVEIFQNEFPEGVPRFAYDFIVSGKLGRQIRVLPELESVAGQLCHILEITPQTKYWFAHEKGMLLLKYVINYENGDYVKEEALKVTNVETDIGQFWYPSEVTREMKNGGEILKYELRVDEFVPHINVPSDTFDIDFPIGTKVIDRIANISYVKGGKNGIIEPQMAEKIGIQPADATIMEDNLQDEPKPQTHEKLSEPPSNDANNSSVLGSTSEADKKQGTRNGPIGLLTPSLLIAVAVVAALVLWFGFSGRKFTGKRTNT